MTMTIKKPSDKSLAYLADLVNTRDVSPGKTSTECQVDLNKWLAKKPRSQREVSDMIDRSLKAPRRASYVAATPIAGRALYRPYPKVPDTIPTCKFALPTGVLTTAPVRWQHQEMLFIEVKQLRGKRVIRRLTGAPGAFNRNFVPADAAEELIKLLSNQAFAYKASIAFGTHYSVCGRCGAELTDDVSRDRKMGPVCWDLMEAWRTAAGF